MAAITDNPNNLRLVEDDHDERRITWRKLGAGVLTVAALTSAAVAIGRSPQANPKMEKHTVVNVREGAPTPTYQEDRAVTITTPDYGH